MTSEDAVHGLYFLKVIFALIYLKLKSSLNLFTNKKALKCYNLPVPLAFLWSWANSILPSSPAWVWERDNCIALANCSSSSFLIPCANPTNKQINVLLTSWPGKVYVKLGWYFFHWGKFSWKKTAHTVMKTSRIVLSELLLLHIYFSLCVLYRWVHLLMAS